jgi:hypothetical protein
LISYEMFQTMASEELSLQDHGLQRWIRTKGTV